MFKNSQKRINYYQFYFILLLLHVSATVCHPQGARLYLLSSCQWGFLVDKILCSMLLCVCYVAMCLVPPDHHITYTEPHNTQFYQPKPKLTCNSEGTYQLPEDGTQLPKHVEAAKWNKTDNNLFICWLFLNMFGDVWFLSQNEAYLSEWLLRDISLKVHFWYLFCVGPPVFSVPFSFGPRRCHSFDIPSFKSGKFLNRNICR
jgi:hypothetical protein